MDNDRMTSEDGMIKGGSNGIMVCDYEPFGYRGYLILWYGRDVEVRTVSSGWLLPLYGATRYVCDALNLSQLSDNSVGGRVQRSATAEETLRGYATYYSCDRVFKVSALHLKISNVIYLLRLLQFYSFTSEFPK